MRYLRQELYGSGASDRIGCVRMAVQKAVRLLTTTETMKKRQTYGIENMGERNEREKDERTTIITTIPTTDKTGKK